MENDIIYLAFMALLFVVTILILKTNLQSVEDLKKEISQKNEELMAHLKEEIEEYIKEEQETQD